MERGIDYVLGEGPDLVYQLAMTREQMEKNIVVQQQLENTRAGVISTASIAPKPDPFCGREFIPLSLSNFLKTFEDKPDVEKNALIRLHKKAG